jgi:hypothetical protein
VRLQCAVTCCVALRLYLGCGCMRMCTVYDGWVVLVPCKIALGIRVVKYGGGLENDCPFMQRLHSIVPAAGRLQQFTVQSNGMQIRNVYGVTLVLSARIRW